MRGHQCRTVRMRFLHQKRTPIRLTTFYTKLRTKALTCMIRIRGRTRMRTTTWGKIVRIVSTHVSWLGKTFPSPEAHDYWDIGYEPELFVEVRGLTTMPLLSTVSLIITFMMSAGFQTGFLSKRRGCAVGSVRSAVGMQIWSSVITALCVAFVQSLF